MSNKVEITAEIKPFRFKMQKCNDMELSCNECEEFYDCALNQMFFGFLQGLNHNRQESELKGIISFKC